MSSTQLSCNLLSCRKKLNKQAYVTSCSHIFCKHHMENLSENNCLACGTQLRQELDFMLMELNPSEQYKSSVLSGLNPDQIMEIATRAINFFVYQLNYENQYKENSLRRSTQHSEELQHYCTSLTAKFKADMQKQKRTIDAFKRDIEEKKQEIEMQNQQIMQWKRTIAKLQTQVESYKRELVNIRLHSHSSPFTATHSHSSRGSNCHPKLPETISSQRFYPPHQEFPNNRNGDNFAQFLSPFDSPARYHH